MKLLKRHRLARGMTQGEVARKGGFTIATYSRWETGRSLPHPKNLKVLARVFDIPTFELTRIIVPDSQPGESVPLPA